MGRTITPKYALEIPGQTVAAWQGRVPTVAKLEEFVMDYVVSTMPGFVNEHIGKANGVTVPSFARVLRNDGSRRVVVEWKAPAFMVLPNPADHPKVAKSFRRQN